MSALLDKVEAAKAELDKAVEWNFGYVDDDPRTNYWLENLEALKKELESQEPENYEIFINKYY